MASLTIAKKSKRLVVFAAGVVLLLGTARGLAFLSTWREDPLVVAFEKVCPGMTPGEVESLMGPGGVHIPAFNSEELWVIRWDLDDAEIYVFFDANGKSEEKRLTHERPTFTERVRRFLGL